VTLDRAGLDARIAAVTAKAPHRPEHIAAFVDAVLSTPVPGVLVECGAYQGVSTAKLSHLAAALGRQLWVFDSFEGLPPHDEPHTADRHGTPIGRRLDGGRFAASLGEAQDTVARFGVPEVVRWVPGWFDATLPAWVSLGGPVAAVYLDVDLAVSVRTCLDHLWPLVSPGGCVVSQDGDLPLAVDAMARWAEDCPPPLSVSGLGTSTMVVLRK
jgi:O-methyltransferase